MGAESAEERIARRQAEPDDVVDDRYFRMVEHRLGEHDPAAAELRPHGERRHDREQRRGAVSAAGKIGEARSRGGPSRPRAQRRNAANRRRAAEERHGHPPEPGPGQDRQRQRARTRPTPKPARSPAPAAGRRPAGAPPAGPPIRTRPAPRARREGRSEITASAEHDPILPGRIAQISNAMPISAGPMATARCQGTAS